MIVISDTSAISALLLVEKSDLLKVLFGEVLIPEAVAKELKIYHNRLPSFVSVCPVQDKQAAESFKVILDNGESEAIQLSIEQPNSLLLMDETLGRKIAKQENLKVVGLMGVLLMAKAKGLLKSITPLISRLEVEAGFYISESVKFAVLKEAGEGD